MDFNRKEDAAHKRPGTSKSKEANPKILGPTTPKYNIQKSRGSLPSQLDNYINENPIINKPSPKHKHLFLGSHKMEEIAQNAKGHDLSRKSSDRPFSSLSKDLSKEKKEVGLNKEYKTQDFRGMPSKSHSKPELMYPQSTTNLNSKMMNYNLHQIFAQTPGYQMLDIQWQGEDRSGPEMSPDEVNRYEAPLYQEKVKKHLRDNFTKGTSDNVRQKELGHTKHERSELPSEDFNSKLSTKAGSLFSDLKKNKSSSINKNDHSETVDSKLDAKSYANFSNYDSPKNSIEPQMYGTKSVSNLHSNKHAELQDGRLFQYERDSQDSPEKVTESKKTAYQRKRNEFNQTKKSKKSGSSPDGAFSSDGAKFQSGLSNATIERLLGRKYSQADLHKPLANDYKVADIMIDTPKVSSNRDMLSTRSMAEGRISKDSKFSHPANLEINLNHMKTVKPSTVASTPKGGVPDFDGLLQKDFLKKLASQLSPNAKFLQLRSQIVEKKKRSSMKSLDVNINQEEENNPPLQLELPAGLKFTRTSQETTSVPRELVSNQDNYGRSLQTILHKSKKILGDFQRKEKMWNNEKKLLQEEIRILKEKLAQYE